MDTPHPIEVPTHQPEKTEHREHKKQPETFALVPLTFVRSAMFKPCKLIKSEERPKERRKIAAEIGPLGIDIDCDGPLLNQEHFLAWQAAIYLGRIHAGMDGTKFVVHSNELLRLMAKGYRDHDQRKLLWILLSDLQATRVYLKSHRSRYVGNLLDALAKDDKTGVISIRLNPDLANLLADETLENDVFRMASLGRDQIAMWLHNYFASWGKYRNVSVSDLHRMCGTNLDERRFRYRLKQALPKLKNCEGSYVTDIHLGNDDIVYVTKTTTKVRLLKPEDKEKSGGNRLNAQHDAARKAAAARAKVCH